MSRALVSGSHSCPDSNISLIITENEVVVLHIYSDRVRPVDFLCQYVFRQLIEHETVDSPLHRTCAKLGVVAFIGKIAQSLGSDFKLNARRLLQHALYAVQLQAHNLFDFGAVEGRKHYYFVDTVEELRTDIFLKHLEYPGLGLLHYLGFVLWSELGEVLAYELRTHIRCHDDYGVLEVHVATFVVGETSVVEHLKEYVEHNVSGCAFSISSKSTT